MNPRDIIEVMIVDDEQEKKSLGLQVGRAVAGVVAGIVATVAAKNLFDRAVEYKDNYNSDDGEDLSALQYNE